MTTRSSFPIFGIARSADVLALLALVGSAISSTGTAAENAPTGMVWIPPGEFTMGSNAEAQSEVCTVFGPKNDAGPEHRVQVDGFWMDETDVTNAQFAAFVAATGYVTIAERPLLAKDFPGVPLTALVPGSLVFSPPSHPVGLSDARAWWRYVPGASWRHPESPESDLRGRADHPVVQVAYADALAYAHWVGKRLPTEAEWERAARGGVEGQLYAWGNELKPGGRWMANIWQGPFPLHNAAEDGYVATSPVRHFPANSYGLYDMAGNVWQWCSDWYRADTYTSLANLKGVARNPQGPETSLDPAEPQVPKRVLRGGSFLCTDEYCTAYTVASRGRGDPDTALVNVGFRCVCSAKSPPAGGK